MPGVTIGDGAIIASNSLVAKDVEPFTIVGGNPSKELKKRFSEEKIEELLKIQWWNFEQELISDNIEAILSYDIEVLKKLK